MPSRWADALVLPFVATPLHGVELGRDRHGDRPGIAAAVLPAGIDPAIAPATAGREIQVLGHPSLGADLHRAVDHAVASVLHGIERDGGIPRDSIVAADLGVTSDHRVVANGGRVGWRWSGSGVR